MTSSGDPPVTLRDGQPLRLPGQQPIPDVAYRDQVKVVGWRAGSGQPVGIEQGLVIEGHMTRWAMRLADPLP